MVFFSPVNGVSEFILLNVMQITISLPFSLYLFQVETWHKLREIRSLIQHIHFRRYNAGAQIIVISGICRRNSFDALSLKILDSLVMDSQSIKKDVYKRKWSINMSHRR